MRQARSPEARHWFAADRQPALWVATPAEVTSALWRLVREEALAVDDAFRADRRGDELAAAAYLVSDVPARFRRM